MPPNPTATPIISLEFGERILVDLKQLQGRAGYIVVAICHWSNYCWLEYLRDKTADGVADFLTNKVFPDVERLRKSWRGGVRRIKEKRQSNTELPGQRGRVGDGRQSRNCFPTQSAQTTRRYAGGTLRVAEFCRPDVKRALPSSHWATTSDIVLSFIRRRSYGKINTLQVTHDVSGKLTRHTPVPPLIHRPVLAAERREISQE